MRIFIGYDSVESIAYHTLCQSIIEHASEPVQIIPLSQSMLPMYTRKRDSIQPTEFSYTRYLVPYLCGYKGWAMFMDCDMLFRDDPLKLWELRDDSYEVQVVKHDYTPSVTVKFLGNVEDAHPRKNWPSVMLFNCDRCKNLTPEYVNTASREDLHQLRWAEDIGGLPREWNHLVGEYPYDPDAKIAHFTIGGPYFEEYRNVDYADDWFNINSRMERCVQLQRKAG